MLRRALAGCLALAAAGLVTTAAGSAAHADLKAPFARAGAVVGLDGSLIDGKNIYRTWRSATGQYCVQVAHFVDTMEALIQITPRHAARLPYIAYRFPSTQCSNQPNTITVSVVSTDTGRLADGGFDLLIS
ncbi:hypothetical protein Nocox_32770 [Nonomuraea coxensis DSM 45129]|uniref:Uncharacterized protein n=1 Tax=Nonomuraea coxensis DSM 45129 TaxID=1122611 RepID=A0ABX8U8P5_9ACTN|nr:hypothetical protein [Nonomuraea coxensis]QYC44125.1 hypothetical protein Nocox_32770 [Nonomuraea coxensis DSM 45129]